MENKSSIETKMPPTTVSSMVLFTSLHSSHDTMWLLQDSTSKFVCLACIVETLDNQNELNYRKRRLLQELLDLLTSNNLIWTLLASNSLILSHTGKVLLKLLTTKDSDLSYLLVETLSVLAKKSKDDSAVSLLDALIDLFGSKDCTQEQPSANQICLLGKILKNSSAASEKFLNQHQRLLESIAHRTAKQAEKEAISYWYILSQIYRDGNGNRINERVSKLVLESMGNAITTSTTTELQMNILSVLMHFSKDQSLKDMSLQLENEESAFHEKKFIEGIKKLLLSSNWEIQAGTLQCITNLITCEEMKKNRQTDNLAECYIDKGVCEYLFDLLGSSSSSVISSVLLCLKEFTNHRKFFTAGHLIYGLDPIVGLLQNIAEKKDSFILHKALTLVLEILIKSDRLLISQISVLHRIISTLNRLCPFKEIQLMILSISCTKEIFELLTMLDQVSIELIYKILDNSGKMLLADARANHGKINGKAQKLSALSRLIAVVQSSYKLIKKTISIPQKSHNEEISEVISCRALDDLINYIYYITDAYMIPITVIWLHMIDNESILLHFFTLITNLVDNSEDLSFARKLSQSSFIQLASEIKTRFFKTDAEEEFTRCIDSFLISLVCKLEESCKAATLRLLLSETLPCLHIPTSEWPVFFTGKLTSNDATNVHIVRCCQVASLALAYSAARFGEFLWRPELVIRTLHTFLDNEMNFKDLPELSKVHIIYLWSKTCTCYVGIDSRLQSTQNVIISFLNNCNNIETYYFSDNFYFNWIMASELKYESKKRVLTIFLMHEPNHAVENVLPHGLIAFKENADFYIMCSDIIANGTEDQVTKCSRIVVELLKKENLNSGSFSLSVKLFIHRYISSHVSNLHHINLSALINFYRILPLPHQKLTEIDLKFAFGVCSIFIDYSYHDVRLSILNGLTYFLHFMRLADETIPQVAVLCNDRFLQQVISVLPQNVCFADSAVEKLAAAGLIFIAGLAALIMELPSYSHSICPLTIKKDTLITGLASQGSPLFKMACVYFWQLFLRNADSKKNLISVKEGKLTSSKNEMKTLLVYLQNLLLNENNLLKQLSLGCLKELFSYCGKDKPLKSPWNVFLIHQFLEKLINQNDIEFNLECLILLVKNGCYLPTYDICNQIKAFTREQCDKTRNDKIDWLLKQLIFFLVDNCQLLCEDKEDLNHFLHKIEDRPCEIENANTNEAIHAPFIVYKDVLFPWTNNEEHEHQTGCSTI